MLAAQKGSIPPGGVTGCAALADAPPGDRHSMAFCGALVATGEALAVVVATGEATQIGQISGLLAAVGTLETSLLRRINGFGRRFSDFAFSAPLLLFVIAVALRGFAWDEARMAVVALAVGQVPEWRRQWSPSRLHSGCGAWWRARP
nr:hypothetical protein [Paracoccus sp. IB05]